MIVADVHNHTNASHGKASVGEMYAAAKDRGLAVYGFSEHSPRPEAYSYPVEYREHLRQNFVRYASEVMQLRALSGSPKVLLGMELVGSPPDGPSWRPPSRRIRSTTSRRLHFLGFVGVRLHTGRLEDQPAAVLHAL